MECGDCGQSWPLIDVIVAVTGAIASATRLLTSLTEEAQRWNQSF